MPTRRIKTVYQEKPGSNLKRFGSCIRVPLLHSLSHSVEGSVEIWDKDRNCSPWYLLSFNGDSNSRPRVKTLLRYSKHQGFATQFSAEHGSQ